ncbi:hypothetical protein ACC870_36560, partial [Rhizobium ruizarguesonis]
QRNHKQMTGVSSSIRQGGQFFASLDMLSQLENNRLDPIQYQSLADLYQKMIEAARAKLKALETSPQSLAVVSM